MPKPLFRRVLAKDWDNVPAPIATIHEIGDGVTWHGAATVLAGPSLLARMVSVIGRLPPSAENVSLTVQMIPDGSGETWLRRFGTHPMSSLLIPGRAPGTINETLGGITAYLRLHANAHGILQTLEGMRLCGIPLPKVLWPDLKIEESAVGDTYRFLVAISIWGIPLLRYEGHLETKTTNES
ncbi:MAG: DUF4166 domain-containing protein [Pseudomonadota bacterium]